MPGINETDALEKAKTEDGTQGFSLADSARETQDVPTEQPVAEPSITVQPIAQQPVAKEPATEEVAPPVKNAPVKAANTETPLSEDELARLASEQEKTQQQVFDNLVTDYAWLREPYTETISPEDVEKARKRGAELRDKAVRRISQAADSITTKEGVEWYAYDLADEIMMVYCPECGGDEKELKKLTGHSKIDLARKILWGLSNIVPNVDSVIRRIKSAKTEEEQMEIYNDWCKANGFEKDENYDVYSGSDALATLRLFKRRYNGTILAISRFAEDQDQLVEAMRLSVLEGDAKEQYLFELNTANRDRAYRTYALAEAMRAYNEGCAVGVLLSNILTGFQQAPKDIMRHISPEETEEQLNWEDFAKFVNKRNGLWWGDYGKKEAWLTKEQWRIVIGEWNDEKQKGIEKVESELRSLTRDFDEHGGDPEQEFEADKLRQKIAKLANEKLIDADDAKRRYHEGWLLESRHFARQQAQQLNEDRFKPSDWGKSFLAEAGRVTGYMLPAVITGVAVSAATGGAMLPATVMEILLWYPSLYQEAYEYYDQMGDTTTRLQDRRNAATLAGMVNAVSQAAAMGIVVRGSSVVARGVSRALGRSAAKTGAALEKHGLWTFAKDVFTLPTRQFAAKYYNGAVKTISLALVRNAARFGVDITAEGIQEASEEIVKHAAREYYGAHIKNYEGKQAVNLDDVVQATWENFKAASLDSILAMAIIRGGHAGIRRVVHRGRLPIGELGFVRIALDGTKDVRFFAALEEAKAGASEGVFKRKNFVIDFLSDDEEGREKRRKSTTYRHLSKDAKESLETLAKTADKIDAESRKRVSNLKKVLTPEQAEELSAKGGNVSAQTYSQWTKANLMKAIFGGETAGLEWFSPEQAEAATNLFSAQYQKLLFSQRLAAVEEQLRADAEKLNDKNLSQKEFEEAQFSQWHNQELRSSINKEIDRVDKEIRNNLAILKGKDLHSFAMAGKPRVSRSQVVNTILEIQQGKAPADVKLSEGTIAFLRETFGIGDEEIKPEKKATEQTSTTEAKSEEKKESVFTTEKTAKYVPPEEPAEEPAKAEPEEEKPTEAPAQEEPASTEAEEEPAPETTEAPKQEASAQGEKETADMQREIRDALTDKDGVFLERDFYVEMANRLKVPPRDREGKAWSAWKARIRQEALRMVFPNANLQEFQRRSTELKDGLYGELDKTCFILFALFHESAQSSEASKVLHGIENAINTYVATSGAISETVTKSTQDVYTQYPLSTFAPGSKTKFSWYVGTFYVLDKLSHTGAHPGEFFKDGVVPENLATLSWNAASEKENVTVKGVNGAGAQPPTGIALSMIEAPDAQYIWDWNHFLSQHQGYNNASAESHKPVETTEAERQKEALEKTVEDVRDLAQDNEGVLTNRQVDDVVANNNVNVASKEEQEVIRDAVKFEAFLGEHTKRIFSGMTAGDESTPKDMFGDDFLITMWKSVNAFGLLAQTEQGRAAIAGLADAVDAFVESKGELLPEQVDLVKNVHERNALKFFVAGDDFGFYRYINGLAVYNALWKRTGGDANPHFWNGTVADDLPRLALEFAQNGDILELPSEMEDLVWLLNNGDNDIDLAGIRDSLRVVDVESALEQILGSARDEYKEDWYEFSSQKDALKKRQERDEEKRVKRGKKKSKKEKKEDKQEDEEEFNLEAERMPRSAVETMERLRAMKPLQQSLDLEVERSAKPSAETEVPTTETEQVIKTEQPELLLGGEPPVETKAEPKKQDTKKTERKAFATPEEQEKAWLEALDATPEWSSLILDDNRTLRLYKRTSSGSYELTIGHQLWNSVDYVSSDGTTKNRLEDLQYILARIGLATGKRKWKAADSRPHRRHATSRDLLLLPSEVPFVVDYLEGVLGLKLSWQHRALANLGVTFGVPAEILRDFLPGSDIATRLKQKAETPVETKAETEAESEKPFEVPPPKPLTDEEWNAQFERQLSTLRRVAENNEVAERIKTSDKQLKIYEKAIERGTEKARKAHEAVAHPNPRARAGTKEKNVQKEADAIKAVQNDMRALEHEKQWRSMLTRLNNGSRVDQIERVFRGIRKEQKRNPNAKPLNIFYQWDGEVNELSASAVMKSDQANIQDKLQHTRGRSDVRVLSDDEIRRAYMAQQNEQAARRAEWDALVDQLEASRLRDEMYRQARTEEEETEDLLNELRMRAGDWEHVTDRARDRRNPDYIQYQLGNKQAGRFKERINTANKHGRKITPEEEKKFFDYATELDDPKHQCAALNWFIAGTIIPGEDEDTFRKACKLLDNNNAWGDYKSPAWTSQWESPLAVCYKYDPTEYGVGAPTIEEIKNLPYLHDMRVIGEGENAVYVFDMDNTYEAAAALCENIVQKWYTTRPWCLMQWDNDGKWSGKEFWDDYDVVERGVAFDARGKPVAFRSADDRTEGMLWWDEHDRGDDGIRIKASNLKPYLKPEQFGLKDFDGLIVAPCSDDTAIVMSGETGRLLTCDIGNVKIVDRAGMQETAWSRGPLKSYKDPFVQFMRVPLDKEGRRHGVMENGIEEGAYFKETITWKHGVKDGATTELRFRHPGSSPKDKTEGQYKNGMPSGEWVSYWDPHGYGLRLGTRKIYAEKGSVHPREEISYFYDSGQIEKHRRLNEDGQDDGIQEWFYDNEAHSLLKREEWKNGKLLSATAWHKAGFVTDVTDRLSEHETQTLSFTSDGNTLNAYLTFLYENLSAENGDLERCTITVHNSSARELKGLHVSTCFHELIERYRSKGGLLERAVRDRAGVLYRELYGDEGSLLRRFDKVGLRDGSDVLKDTDNGDDVPERPLSDFFDLPDAQKKAFSLFAEARERHKDIIKEPSSDDVMYELTSAFHASPAFFRSLDTHYMGRGEGAQAYGWGSYLTSEQWLARQYAGRLGDVQNNRAYNYILEKQENLERDMLDAEYGVETYADGNKELGDILVAALQTGKSFSDARKFLIREAEAGIKRSEKLAKESITDGSRAAHRRDVEGYVRTRDRLWAISTDYEAKDYVPDFARLRENYAATLREFKNLETKLNELEARWNSGARGKRHHVYKVAFDDATLLTWDEKLTESQWDAVRASATEFFRAQGRELPPFFCGCEPPTPRYLHTYCVERDIKPVEMSMILRRAGFAGHRYPSDYQRGNKDYAKGTNYVIYTPESDTQIVDHTSWQILGTDKNGLPNGWFNRRTGEIVLREGCPADTIIHEVCGHATTYWAKLNAPKLYKKLMDYARSAPQSLKDMVTERYRGKLQEGSEEWLEEVGAWLLAREFSGELDSWVKTKEEKTWLKKVKELLARIWHAMIEAIGVKSSLARELSRDGVTPQQAARKIVEAFKEGRWLGTLKPRQDAAIKFMLGADKINGSLYGGARPRERENTPLAQYLNAANLFNSVLDGTKPGGAEADKKRADLEREAEATRLVDRARIRRNILINTKAGRDFTEKRMFAAGIPKFGSEEGGIEGWGKKVVDKLYEHVLSGALGEETPHGTFNTSAKLVAEYAKEVLLPHYMSAGEEIFTKEEADKVSPLLDQLAESNETYEIIDLSKKIEDAFLNASNTKETLARRRGIIHDMLSNHAEWDNSRGKKHLLTSWFQHELWRGLTMPGRTKEARAKNIEKAWNDADKIFRTTTSEAHRNEALMTMRAMEFFKDGVPLKDWGMTRLSALYATIQFARTTGKDVLLAQKEINEARIESALNAISAAAISASVKHKATKASHVRRPLETTFSFRESLNAIFDYADPELAKAATDAATTLDVDIQKGAIKAGDIQYQCNIRFKEAAFKAYDKKFYGKGIGRVVDKARLAFIVADLNKVMKGGERFSADGKKKRTKLQLLNQFLAMKQKKVTEKLSSLTENDKANLDKSGRDLLKAWEMNDELAEFLGAEMVQFAKDVSQILRDLAPMIDEQSMKDVGMALSEMDEWYFPLVRDLGIFMQNANPYGGEPLTITQAVKDKLKGEMRGIPYLPTVPAFLTSRTLNLLYIDESADMFSVFHRRVFDVAQYVGFGDVKPVLTALLVGEEYQHVRDAIAKVRGKPALKALIEHGTQILNGYMEGANLYMLEKADKVAHSALVFSRTLALCGSLTSGLVQAIGSSAASATTLGWSGAGRAFWTGISNPKELSAEIIRLTQHAGYRARYGDPDAILMSAASRAARSKIPIKLALSLLEMEQIGYLPVSYGDRVPVLLMGASYCLMRKKELYEQGLSREEAEKQATEEAFHMIDETQQSHTTQGRDAWSRSEHEIAKFGIQFRTSVAQYAAKEVRAWEKFLANPTVENFQAVLSISIHNHLVAPGLAAIARSLGFLIIASMDDKDRSLLDYMDVVHLKTSQLLLGSADALPFIGQVGATGLQKLIEAGSETKKKGYYSGRVIDVPAFSIGTRFGKDLWELYEHGGDEKYRKRLYRNFAAYRQASAIWKFFEDD